MVDKETASFISLGLMIAASILITISRSKTKGIFRILLSTVAFLLLIPILLYGLFAMS